MEEIRIGVAGLGKRGLHFINIIQNIPEFRITAVCDKTESLLDGAVERVRGEDVKSYTDYAEFLSDDNVDAVALVVRSLNQGGMAAQAIEAGKHVNADVPAAHSIEDCWRLVVAVEKTGKTYQLAEQTRYWGYVEAWKDIIASGQIGRVTYCESQYMGYYADSLFFRDTETGEYIPVSDAARNANVKPGVMCFMPPIHYLPHELSPMLKALDDRVTEVVGMSTGAPSYAHPEINQPDIQVALMKTEKDAVLRMLTGFTMPCPLDDHHWNQIIGTGGRLEWRRTPQDRPKMWTAASQMHGMAEVDWRLERTDAPPEAVSSGHGDADWYVHATFRDIILGRVKQEFDVYKAVETAAPAILAAESIERGSAPLPVPDFRPNANRKPGETPNN